MFDILRNPTVIATFLSLGVHGLLGLNTPVLVGSFSSSNKDDGKNGVGVVNLSPVEQNRIPGLVPNSNTLSTIPGLPLPSNKPVKTLPLLPPLSPLDSVPIPSIYGNPNPSQQNIISSQNKSAIKIPSNPNIPPLNNLEPLPDIGGINERPNRSEEAKYKLNTKSSFSEKNNNLKDPSEIDDRNGNDLKSRRKNTDEKIKPRTNNNEQIAFNNLNVNPKQDPRLWDKGPSFSPPISENNQKNNDDNSVKKQPENDNNIPEQTNKPKNTKKTENTIKTKKPKNQNKIVKNTPSKNRRIPIFGDSTTDASQLNIGNNQIDIRSSEKPEIDPGKDLSNYTTYDQTGTSNVEATGKYGDWATKHNPNYSQTEKDSFTSFNYPKDACFKQLEGNVAIVVLVDKNGKVQDETAEIMISSGYKILNDQAMEDLKKRKFQNDTDKSKPYSVEIKYEYDKKRCPTISINNKKKAP